LWHADVDIEPHAPMVSVSHLPINTLDIPKPTTSLAQAFELAEQRFPDFKSTYVMLPEHARDTYKLFGKGDFIFYDEYSYGVIVNPWTGVIESVRQPDEMATLQTLSHIVNPLHYGNIGGLWTKGIWFLFGVLLTGMSITGFLMWSGRTIKASRNASQTVEKDNEIVQHVIRQEYK
jgi:uncharacterized iron-regulated membrane protein